MLPHCRSVRRLVERNSRNLHKRKCDLTGKEFLSPYNDVTFPVYDADEWFDSGWDELKYGQDVYLNRPFFEQLETLWNAVPRMGRFICPGTLENCDYTNCIGYSKDCYMTAEADYNEKVMYSNRVFHKQQFENFRASFPERSLLGVRNENVSGNYLAESRDAIACFDSHHLWEGMYATQAFASLRGFLDCDECGGGELMIETANSVPRQQLIALLLLEWKELSQWIKLC